MYNPNVAGKQVIIDVKNIESDRLKTIANIQPLMDKIVEEFKLSVVAKSEHQFEKDNVPYGCTIMILLSESHLFVHTFVDCYARYVAQQPEEWALGGHGRAATMAVALRPGNASRAPPGSSPKPRLRPAVLGRPCTG